LSRDRLGVKPLHYAKLPSTLIFASEIKGVLSSGFISARLNHKCAADFLRWGSVNHSDESFFEGVREFPAGHFAEVDPDRPYDWEAQAFWRLSALNRQESIDPSAAVKHFRELFLSAVSLRMRSDVPVGSCLSGGLDSSSIVCVANRGRHAGEVPFHTFTSSFNDLRFDERQWSELVSAHARTTAHHVFPDAGDFLRDLPKLLWHQEEPFTTTSIYAQWQVMRAAREAGVPVLLDGQGADEILCGYRKYQFFYLRELANAGRWLQLAQELAMLVRFGDRGLWRWREGERYLPKFLKQRLTSIDELIHQDFHQTILASNLPLTAATTVTARQVDDLLYFSLPSLLRYEDRNSMAWAVESRVPFLDYRLVEFAVALPAQVKLQRGRSKAILRTALRGLVPDAVLDRRDKLGFVTPQEVWLRGELASSIEGAFRGNCFAAGGIVVQNRLMRLWNNFIAGDSTSEQLVFRIFVLDAWLQRFNVKI
jgi:asparagine synthase (glutamine-hydrolysing)